MPPARSPTSCRTGAGLPDDRTCLTRRGELVTLARLSPTVVDGHTPEQLDAVLNRWQRMMSGIDSRTRLYFYLLRRPAIFETADTGLSAVADLGQRKRRAFLSSRIQQIDTFVAWCYDPRLSSAAAGAHHAPWWKNYLRTWLKRRRNPNEAMYFREQITDAAARFRQHVDASRTLVADLTPPRDSFSARRLPRARRAGEQARPRAVGWRDRQRDELAARHKRTRSRTPAPSPRRRARHSVLAVVPTGTGHREPAQRPVPGSTA